MNRHLIRYSGIVTNLIWFLFLLAFDLIFMLIAFIQIHFLLHFVFVCRHHLGGTRYIILEMMLVFQFAAGDPKIDDIVIFRLGIKLFFFFTYLTTGWDDVLHRKYYKLNQSLAKKKIHLPFDKLSHFVDPALHGW